MAVAPSLSAYARNGSASERYFESEVRRLLRHAKNPYLLAADPLAQAICETTGIPNAREALLRAVETAFGTRFEDQRARVLILGSLEESAAAEPPHSHTAISRRHFYRRRAKAVAVLAYHVRQMIGQPALDLIDERVTDPLETMADLVANIEPAVACSLLRLNHPGGTDQATILALRERLDAGAVLEIPEGHRNLSKSLLAILSEQSRAIAGQDSRDDFVPPLAHGRGIADAESRFESEWLNFLLARTSGNAAATDGISRNLGRLAKDRVAWVTRASLAQAESKIRRGRFDDAGRLLDSAAKRCAQNLAVTDLACATALRAELALCRGDDASAERLAAGAYLVLRGRHYFAFRCQTTLARAHLRLDQPWSWPDVADALAETAWDSVALTIERARHCVAGGDAGLARSLANRAFEIARKRRYRGLAARAASTMGSTYSGGGHKKQEWYYCALRDLLVTRDRSIGCDLFVSETDGAYRDALLGDESPLLEILHDELGSAIPPLRPAARERGAIFALLREVFSFVLGTGSSLEQLSTVIHATNRACPGFVDYFNYFSDEAAEVCQTFFQALVALEERSKTAYRVQVAVNHIALCSPRITEERSFLVG